MYIIKQCIFFVYTESERFIHLQGVCFFRGYYSGDDLGMMLFLNHSRGENFSGMDFALYEMEWKREGYS